jgi:phage host-nuclease inhibitor protein Gam
MVGGGSSELRSLRSEVQRAVEIYGELGLEVTRLEAEVAELQAEVAELRAASAEVAKPARRSKAKPRAKQKAG